MTPTGDGFLGPAARGWSALVGILFYPLALVVAMFFAIGVNEILLDYVFDFYGIALRGATNGNVAGPVGMFTLVGVAFFLSWTVNRVSINLIDDLPERVLQFADLLGLRSDAASTSQQVEQQMATANQQMGQAVSGVGGGMLSRRPPGQGDGAGVVARTAKTKDAGNEQLNQNIVAGENARR